MASFAATEKFSEAPRALRTRFFAQLGRFGARTCSPEGPQDALGFDLGARNNCFFEVFACGKRSKRKTSDIDKALAGAIRNALRSCRVSTENVEKSIRKRFQLRWAMRTALTGVLGVAPRTLGASLGCPGDAFGRLLAALGAPRAPQDRLWGGTWVSKSRPEHIRTRPRNGPGRPKRSKIDFSSILGQVGVDFCRFSLEPRARKEQKQNLKKESYDPQRTSWLLRCGLASYCSHIFRNTFRALHIQLFSLRTHKPVSYTHLTLPTILRV